MTRDRRLALLNSAALAHADKDPSRKLWRGVLASAIYDCLFMPKDSSERLLAKLWLASDDSTTLGAFLWTCEALSLSSAGVDRVRKLALSCRVSTSTKKYVKSASASYVNNNIKKRNRYSKCRKRII